MDLVASFQAFRCNDVTTLAVFVLEQRDVRGSVRIVFQALNNRRNTVFGTLPVNNAVVVLVPTTTMTGGDTTRVIAATGLALTLQQRLVGRALVQGLIDNLDYEAAPRRSWLRAMGSQKKNTLPGPPPFPTPLGIRYTTGRT